LKNYKSLLLIVFLSIFAINVNAEVLTPSEEAKQSAVVYLIKDPTKGNPAFVTDIDNNLTISTNNNNILAGKIESSACLLTDLHQIARQDFGYYRDKERMPFYDVATLYEAYGIFNLSTILASDSEEDLENFAKSLGLEIKVETVCKYGKTGNMAKVNYYSSDVFFISDYLYNEMLEGSKLLQSITTEDVLGSWTFDEIKTLSDNYLTVVAEKERLDNEFKQKYANLAQEKSKEFMGSLYIDFNSYGSQNFCTLGYSGADAVAAVGYRLMGDEMIIDESLKRYYGSQEISLNDSNENQFKYVFDDIGEAFSNIKSNLEANNNNYCNIFIDYPENLLKLKNAIERDLKGKRILGALFDESVTDNQYAIGQGFDNYKQYDFAYQIDAGYREVKSLENYQISNLSEFNKVQDEILSIGYSNDTNISTVLIYLDDLINAQKQNMDVNKYRDARVKEEERLAEIARLEEAKRQAEFAKEYPYTALLTCGMGGGDHISIVACFSGGSSGVDTELEITNGQNYQMYKIYNLRSAGSEYQSGFEINLRNSFKIFAQNSSKSLVLSLKIIDNATGATLYQDSASQYGVINISN
jgi:fructose-specific phosphotransferase system component IIB